MTRREMRIFLRAFFDGFTGAGLFRRLNYPGAPTEFIDSRSLEEIEKSGEFEDLRKIRERPSAST